MKRKEICEALIGMMLIAKKMNMSFDDAFDGVDEDTKSLIRKYWNKVGD